MSSKLSFCYLQLVQKFLPLNIFYQVGQQADKIKAYPMLLTEKLFSES
jgi:hypothetical protein